MKLKLGDGLSLPIEMAGQAVALVGIRGSGKTNTAGVIAEELLDRGQQIVVLDPTDAWWGLRSDYPVFIFGGPHGDLPLNETDGKTLAEFVVQEKVPVILSLRHLRKGAQRRLVMEFCEELYHLKGRPEYREPLTVFIDEAPQFVPQRVMGEMARLVGAVQDMILLGRSAGFGVVMISQRFATLNADVRTQADTVIVHRLPSPLDRKALTEWIEENATIEEQKDVLSSLAKLKTGEAWIWAPYFELFKRAQIRARHTFDSSAAPKRDGVARVPKDLKKVDIEKLKGKLSEAIEKAKADDPRELRKQIAELKREVARHLKVSVEKPQILKESKPVLTDADRALLEKLTAAIAERSAQARETISVADSRLDQAVQKSAAEYLNTVRKVGMDAALHVEQTLERFGFQKILGKLATVASPQPIHPTTQTAPRSPQTRRVDPVPSTSRPARLVSTGSDVSLGKGERVILTAVAQYPDAGVTREQLTILTGYKRSSRDTFLQRLTAAGFATVNGNGNIHATDAGVSALGEFEPLPTGEELQRYWLDRLTGGEQVLLAALVKAYPATVDREALSEATEYKRSSRDTFLQRLSARKLVTITRDGVRASEELFS